MSSPFTQQELWTLRALIQKAGWKKFMIEVGCLAAEQADKVKPDSPQDKNLFWLSNFLHSPAFSDCVKDCGYFDYRQWDEWVPEEFREMIHNSPPNKE